MANSLIGNSAVATHMYQALYGQAPSNALYNSYIADINANGQAAFAKTLTGNFSATTDANLALQVLNNLGVTATTVTATGEYSKLLQALTDAFAAYPTMRGQVILNATNLFGNLESDATYGAAATTYNKQALANFTYASNTANTAPATVALPDTTVGQVYSLTTGVDNITGTTANDTFNAILSTGTSTLTALDSLNGNGGSDTLNLTDVAGSTALPSGLTITNIQTLNLRDAGAATIDTTTGFTGLTAVNVTQSSGTDVVKVGKGTAVSVTDTLAGALVTITASDSAVTVSSQGAATVHGGGAVNVTAAGTVTIDTASTTQTVSTAGGVVLSKATGAIVATDTAQAAVASSIDGGTSVTLTTTAKAAGGTSGTITIGGTTPPTGAVTVTDNLSNVAAAAADGTGGAISITGGTTVSVTETAAQAAMTTASTNSTLNQAAVFVTGTANTTSVSVTQSAAVAAANTVLAVAAVTETGSAVFSALTAGQNLTVGGLTFTATGATTAAQTAAAFANLTKGATQGNSTLGTYSGTLSGWTSGAVSTATVLFTSTTAGPVTDLAFTGTGTAPTLTLVQGVASVDAAGKGGITGGAVTINDLNPNSTTKAGTITSVTLDGYGASAVNSNSLNTLSLANSTGKAVTVGNDKTSGLGATSMALTVNKLGAASTLNLDATTAAYKTLGVTTAGADSVLAVTATAVTALTVAGTNAVDLTGSGFTQLKTVTVSGAAGVKDGGTFAGTNVTGVNASGTTGAVTASIDSSKATYDGGSGVDTVTLTSTTVSKAITLGAGNDSLTLASGTTAPTATVDGGAGTDTLVMVAADAVTASASAGFATKVTGFEVLSVTGATGAQTIDLSMLGGYSSVSSSASAGTLTLSNFANGGTLTVTGTTAGTGYTLTNSAFTAGTSDSVNIAITVAGAIGTVTASSVETVNISDSKASSLTLVDTSAKSIVVTGAGTLTLTSANTSVTSVDASAMTGGLVYTTAGTTAETVKGGAGANTLTAAAGTVADTLIGGAGADTLTANGGMDALTGGAGADTFVIGTASSNLNSYATITDAAAGDSIKLSTTGTLAFAQSKVTLGATAVFQDYANTAVSAGGGAATQGNIAWFQYGGDTYIVQHQFAGAETSFDNGVDMIVKLTGLVDLSNTSLNSAGATLLIA